GAADTRRPRRLLRAQDEAAPRAPLPGPAPGGAVRQAREGPRAAADDPARLDAGLSDPDPGAGSGGRVSTAAILDDSLLDGRGSLRRWPRLGERMRTAWRWRTLVWVLAAWTLVGFFRAADRYFSDPFQRQRLEFGLWEALAQSLLASYIWAAMTP